MRLRPPCSTRPATTDRRMAEIHGLAARVTLLLVLLVVAWSLGLAVTRRAIPTILLGALAWLVILLIVSGLLGALTAATDRPPTDVLHIVYGLLAVAVLPGAWAITRQRDDPRRAVIVQVIASVVLLILVFRLFQTGA